MKKVLIIEDNTMDAVVVKKLLEKEKLEFDVAASAKEGLTKALVMKPDLIVLDLILPDYSGFKLCEQIRKEPSLSNTIIVVLSARDNLEDITRAFEVGVDDYVIKLPMPQFLLNKIKLYLGMYV